MIKPVFLWSDILLFALIVCVIFFILQLRKNPQAKARWGSVFQSKVGMSSFVVISFYVLIAFLDSLHFREALPEIEGQQEIQQVAYSSEVHSVLDVILTDLRTKSETTYSAPFALYSFSKENMTNEEGLVYRDYPRLKYGGAHLESLEQRPLDILTTTLFASLIGLVVVAIPILFHRHWVKKSQENSPYPWQAAYISLALISITTSCVLFLSEFYHIMGTDKVGADVLYQSIKAIRTGVLIGTLATLVTLPFAIILGISAGYFKGIVDDIVQYLYTTLSSIPGILLIAASVLLIDVYIETNSEQFNLTILRSDFKFLALCGILGLTSWTTLCRLLRAETLKVSQLDYVQAAHAFGVSHSRVIRRHILPNITHIILIVIVLDFSMFVLAEAVLSYIGVGVDPNMYSWGNMINAARTELSRDPAVWWSVTSAFVLMFILVLAANLLSDEVRNAFDPRTAKGH
ncbi:ABC transporter permease [Bermanella marisrubri]|uniref:Binding-protein-dependent transport systems inner membrane component n=1 Tax=Bermanella marisrubri TaxID=207949 RepID=Q1N1H2_9GAMM|nr:ABC transporter permease [Bermanella marisrubri]EAT12078.1 Binding-protein-dependent transport systems inner membrane component [Oceanobacter sp. RED65] [Bermanella marisrubri]QIZ83544.1 ABC transporter permease [Bermanella marisrubri]